MERQWCLLSSGRTGAEKERLFSEDRSIPALKLWQILAYSIKKYRKYYYTNRRNNNQNAFILDWYRRYSAYVYYKLIYLNIYIITICAKNILHVLSSVIPSLVKKGVIELWLFFFPPQSQYSFGFFVHWCCTDCRNTKNVALNNLHTLYKSVL